MNLISTSDKVEAVTTSSADLEVRADWVEATTVAGVISADTFKPDNQHTAIATSPGPTDIITAPASNRVRSVHHISIRNKHATTANTVTVRMVNASSTKELFKATLNAGEEMSFKDGTWFVYDTNGAVKAGATAMTDTAAGIVAAALQADMEAWSSVILAVTPGRQHSHPGHPKCWVKAGLTGNILASHNITSLSDTGTGALTVTIATDFSSVNYAALATIEFASTTLVQSCTVDAVAAGSIVLRSVVEAGSAADPVTWSFAGLGDQ